MLAAVHWQAYAGDEARFVAGQDTAAIAMSQAVPILPIGQASSRAFIIASVLSYWPEICWWISGVFIRPGMMQLARMPRRAY